VRLSLGFGALLLSAGLLKNAWAKPSFVMPDRKNLELIPNIYSVGYKLENGNIVSAAEYIQENNLNLSTIAKNVIDYPSFDLLMEATKHTDLNSKDETGKSAVVILTEDIFAKILDPKIIGYKISAIDFLLAHGASIQELKDTLSTIKTPNQRKDFEQAYNEYLQKIMTGQNISDPMMIAYHALKFLLELAAELEGAKKEIGHLDTRSKPKFKPLLAAETHSDSSKVKFVQELAETLNQLGLKHACVERSSSLTLAQHMNHLEAQATRLYEKNDIANFPLVWNGFLHLQKLNDQNINVQFIDIYPTPAPEIALDLKQTALEFIQYQSMTMFGYLYNFYLRDLGMQLLTLKQIYLADGKVVIFMAASHAPGLLNFLKANGIEAISVFPINRSIPDKTIVTDFSTESHGVFLDFKASLFAVGKMIELHLPANDEEEIKQRLTEFAVRLKNAYSAKPEPTQPVAKCVI
jgi:hypothetical protein